ncbi:site-specific DNA-methyltransferase [Faecalicatena contorta]|uniref:Adenine-specific DNA-methyltransferase n=1 Tax=Faecalicatena contorta TaxID=39482 RepID=A0A315ZX93_9FIRM|nr:site-specific DNA-methyltransferase [Faecalicatena contorta]PWJ49929.1 adenine-specific DNA-methyltransferase [Faecalicatena contorta]SUQ14050.1 adenine-specific DNA-methyltransferase [Faecalicatena contorta]
MDKLKMQTVNKADENFKKLAAMFPNAVTETIDENGEAVRAIDKDVLMQEISCKVVDGNEERYQFTWPDKKKSVLLANAPINKTLRPVRDNETIPTGADSGGNPYCSSGSVDFDNTENLYIEGDNLEVLKLLQETYLGKIKMIYIDPPYNTGHDFVYSDTFTQSIDDYVNNSGQIDEEGNVLFQNMESNGRFHTDWLNMIYPRLKLAKTLLSEDGLIFISIDENEVENLKKMCNEVLGESNFLTCVTRATGTPTGGGFDGLVNELDYMLIYAKNATEATINGLEMSEEDSKIYDQVDEQGRYLIRPLRRTGGEDRREDRPTMYFPIIAPDGTEVYPIGPTGYESRWICSPDTAKKLADNNMLAWKQVNKNGETKWQVYQKFYLENRKKAPGNLWTDVEGNKKATRDVRDIFDSKKIFDFPKPVGFLKKAISIGANDDSIIMDFFSGSATIAQAIMQLNAEDGGGRKFVIIQLPEIPDEKSEAHKAGYKNICEIGKERIRRVGVKIKEEAGFVSSKLDVGFRVLKCDSSNMKDVYYNPAEYEPSLFTRLEDNIKEDRTPEDLLFQVMLDLGVLLSSKIEETTIAGKRVFNVEENYLIACFDDNVTEEAITEIAKQKPYYFVMRDSSMANDSVATNFEQIFAAYSPDTVRKVL